MRRHWSEIHGQSEPPSNSSPIARSVKLQTFFRGTKLRYFEVASSPTASPARAVPLATIDDEEERHDEEELAAGTTAPLHPKSSPVNLDMETLTYFHHFTTTTSLTLPDAEEHPRPATHYWQTDMVLEALQRRWLMCGLLAVSAYHLVALEYDKTVVQIHRERAAQFLSEFSIAWEQMVATGIDQETKKAGELMRCILRCAQHWALVEATPKLDQGTTPESAAPSQLQSIMTTIRGFVVPDFALRPSGIRSDDDDDRQVETFAQAKRILEVRSSSDTGNIPSALLNRLRALPSRMAEAFGKPDSAQDVLATLSAIAALVECCETSFASDDTRAAWRGMATWLTKVPGYFHHMVSSHRPAALVVLAHWAELLVERAEHCGCWYLRGAAKAILLQIVERLPADDRAVESLVRDLITGTIAERAICPSA